MAKRRKKESIPPIPTSEMGLEERDYLLSTGAYRVFILNGEEFIVQKRYSPPLVFGQDFSTRGSVPEPEPLPRRTWSYESNGPNKGKKIDLFAWDYTDTTVQDFDDITDAPKSIKNVPNVFAYVVTDSGVHIYQKGRNKLLPNYDEAYERMARENRGWYGDRLKSKDGRLSRMLVTSDIGLADQWREAGGRVRIVSDLKRSYANSVESALRTGTEFQRTKGRKGKK